MKSEESEKKREKKKHLGEYFYVQFLSDVSIEVPLRLF